MKTVRIAILGATGYTGLELIKLLLRHPGAKIEVLTSRQEGRPHLSTIHPSLTGRLDLHLEDIGPDQVAGRCDFAFLCLPHAASAESAKALLAKGVRVIDFSADYRLNDPATYRQWYEHEHPDPERLGKTPYGLPELFRDQIPNAQLIANPGCYPTSALIPLRPLIDAGVLHEDRTIICDSKSGVTGAGKTPNSTTHFSEVTESLRAYNVFRHRHTPEIAQGLGLEDNRRELVFTPHLLPINRGILTTTYVELSPGVTRQDVLRVWRLTFSRSPFVRIFGETQLPEIKFVANTPFADIGVEVDEESGRAVIVSAIDNLLKGAASQALQNANVALGLDERMGMLPLD
jgi:N-acetyl-gamma-glutamyl-phosphate reductase